jgi:hypothetical protein
MAKQCRREEMISTGQWKAVRKLAGILVLLQEEPGRGEGFTLRDLDGPNTSTLECKSNAVTKGFVQLVIEIPSTLFPLLSASYHSTARVILDSRSYMQHA